jgi:ribose transport system ATP-binding protein
MHMSVRENLTLPLLAPLRTRAGRVGARDERAETERWIADVGVYPPHPEREMSALSGGNQQKVVLAKWLRTRPRVLLLDEPTQGVDVAAKAVIYQLVADAAAAGAAVLICSSETRELVALCHRVLVLRDGREACALDRASLTEERLVRESLGLPAIASRELFALAPDRGAAR